MVKRTFPLLIFFLFPGHKPSNKANAEALRNGEISAQTSQRMVWAVIVLMLGHVTQTNSENPVQLAAKIEYTWFVSLSLMGEELSSLRRLRQCGIRGHEFPS